jgi:glycerol-3-phosphate dehydrogenase
MYDIIIIGAGICGTSVARELSKYDLKVALLDKSNDVSNGSTKANSAIVHAGYDPEPGTLMAKYNTLGNPMFDKLCHDLCVPFKRIGSLVLAFNDEDKKTIQELYDRGIQNNIPDMKIITPSEIKKIEPQVSDNVVEALYAPTAGIVGPWELAIALTENAMDNGVELLLNQEVTNIKPEKDIFHITTTTDHFQAKVVVNAAGVFADKINNMVSQNKIEIRPKRGEYFVLDKNAGKTVHHVLFPTPNEKGKGILVTPTVHGNVLVGPNSVYIDEKEDKATTSDGLAEVRTAGHKTMENISYRDTINIFSGIRAEPENGDFIIGEAADVKNFINIAGIKSPGLSAAPAIAIDVVEIIKNCLQDVKKNKNFNPLRKKQIHFAELSNEEKQKLIAKNPQYAHVICRCENITEGEIVDSIHRNAGACTIDGVKRRTRPGTGRCQGGFCMPHVMKILARELNLPMEKVMKDEQNSPTITGETKNGTDDKIHYQKKKVKEVELNG